LTRVVVTRAEGRADQLTGRLRAAGFDVVSCPLIEIETIDDGPIEVEGYDWLVVTSVHGAEELARRRVGDPARVAAVGEATAVALRARGLAVDFVPRQSTQDGLVAEFPRPFGRVLFVGAEGARGLIVGELGADFRAVYRTRELRPDPPPAGDLAVVSSPSAARALAALDCDLPVVAIGPQTAAAARGAGLAVVAEARRPSVEALVDAVREASG
jgi:uroporphyrinogen-III synthase